VEANPKQQVDTEELEPADPGLSVALKGLHDTVSGNYFVSVEVTNIPIYQPNAQPPPAGETIIPDNDDLESKLS